MDEPVCAREIVIRNPNGLHARPADLFVKKAREFSARVQVIKEDVRVDGKSILDLLTLAAELGTPLTLEAVGSDAEQAVTALAALLESQFHD